MLAGARNGSPGLRLVRAEPEHIVLAHEQPFRIGAAEFRPPTREVSFNGRSSIVEPRVMQLLVALNRANGGVVSKDDLAILCWEGRIVGEDAINRVVSRLRSVADKQAGRQFKVETITKVGYRLVPAGAARDDGTIDRGADSRSSLRLGRRELLVGGAAVGIAAAAGLGWTLLGGEDTPREAKLLIADSRNSLREGNSDDADNAVAKLRRAVEIAPSSAEAWGMLAFAYMVVAGSAPAVQRPALRARGKSAAQRALDLQPHQADATVANILSTRQYRNWYSWEMACREALARHPDHAVLNCMLAYILGQVGRVGESLPLNEKGLASFPLSSRLHVIRVMNLWDLGRLDEAEAALAKSFAMMPRYYGLWFTRLYFLMYNGRPGEAAAMIDDEASRPLGIPDWNYDLTATQVHALASGDRSEISRTVELWKTEAQRGTGFTENAAIFAGFVGDLDESFRLLNGLYFNRGARIADTYFSKEQGNYAGVERHTFTLFRRPIAPIRQDPRFAALTRELGLDDYWRRTNSRALAIA